MDRGESRSPAAPLDRTSTKFGRTADREDGWSQTIACVAVLPLAAMWCHVSMSWYSRLWPTLQDMQDQAASFGKQHQIAGEPGDDEFSAWHDGIDAMQKSFRRDAAELFESGRVSSALSVFITVFITCALLYLTTFLPEGAVFLSEATQQALRRPLNAVNYVRAPLGLMACHQAWLLWTVLRAALEVAATMEANVNDLKQQSVEFVRRGVQVNAHIHDGRRWGVKILGFTVDRKAWQECRLNVAVVVALLVACSHIVWVKIQAEREAQGMRETNFLKKIIGEAEKKTATLQEEVDHARLEKQRSSAFIAFESLDIGEKLGGGSFGTVYQGKWHGGGGVPVAIKDLHEGSAEAEAEVELLLRLRHPNIVKCYGQAKVAKHLYIVTQLCGKYGSLFKLMHRTTALNAMSQSRWLAWMNQIASGMTYLHNEGVLHRDLKSENVLVADDKTMKICDFGLSRATAERSAEHLSKAEAGTYIYVAPEVINLDGVATRVPYTTACDIYSYAVLINEMASRQIPWAEIQIPVATAKQIRVFNKVKSGERPSLAAETTSEFQRLVQDCWQQDPARRPCFNEVQQRLQKLGSFQSA